MFGNNDRYENQIDIFQTQIDQQQEKFGGRGCGKQTKPTSNTRTNSKTLYFKFATA
jgi:hypothetical protein